MWRGMYEVTGLPDVSNPGTEYPASLEPGELIEPSGSETAPKWYRWRREGKALVKYLLDSEIHTYAFSVAANAILSFIPFIVLLYTLAISVFHSRVMAGVVSDMVRYFLPSNQDWVAANLALAAAHQGVQVLSLVMILIACTGIFLPLEVALNQAWGIRKSRNYLMNQAVAFGLALLMLALAMGSILLSAWQRQLLSFLFFNHTNNFVFRGLSYIWMSLATGVACIVFFFSIYWLLPNRKVPPRHVMRTSIFTGLAWLGAKYLFVAVLPHLDLKALYGPFYVSVGLLFWAYVSGLILFAGAQFSVARFGAGDPEQ
ncbi:MAG TPA: YihY/virulence factor BrkB family protein [Terracidiphilus sp.]|nr:YihY/virulence factor BrkB family protein [Terracidiphilus sp.]